MIRQGVKICCGGNITTAFITTATQNFCVQSDKGEVNDKSQK